MDGQIRILERLGKFGETLCDVTQTLPKLNLLKLPNFLLILLVFNLFKDG